MNEKYSGETREKYLIVHRKMKNILSHKFFVPKKLLSHNFFVQKNVITQIFLQVFLKGDEDFGNNFAHGDDADDADDADEA